MLAACVPANVHDLALEGVHRPRPEQRRIARHPFSGDRIIGVVAMLSTSRDLRQQGGENSDSFTVRLTRCEGRTHVPDREPWGPLVDHAGLYDERGAPILDPLAGQDELPHPTRFTYWLPISLVTLARESRLGAEGRLSQWSVDHDLRNDTADLCLYARGAVMLLGTWRTNTVVIPRAAIRAAVAEGAQ